MKRYPDFLVIAVIAAGVLTWLGTKWWYVQKAYKGETSIRLFFPGNGQWPEAVESHNIYHWNVFRRDSPRNWLIFLIFNQEVNTDTLVVRAHSKVFPAPTTIQAKECGRRGAVLTSAEDFPQGELEIKMEPSAP